MIGWSRHNARWLAPVCRFVATGCEDASRQDDVVSWKRMARGFHDLVSASVAADAGDVAAAGVARDDEIETKPKMKRRMFLVLRNLNLPHNFLADIKTQEEGKCYSQSSHKTYTPWLNIQLNLMSHSLRETGLFLGTLLALPETNNGAESDGDGFSN